jgi:hypothetical protein
MMVPIVNRTRNEVLLGFEPEGDTLPLAPGQQVIVKTNDKDDNAAQLELDIEEGLFVISMMCKKEVWCGDVRLR